MTFSRLKSPRNEYSALYHMRLTRLIKLVELDAPITIIGTEARLISECFEYSWRARINGFLIRIGIAHWYFWITSKEYRGWSAGDGPE